MYREKTVILGIDEVSNRTTIDFSSPSNIPDKIALQGRLATQLGFDPGENILNYTKSPQLGNIFFGIPDQMIVSTDIIQPSFVGHERSYILKIVNTQAKLERYGDSCYEEFQNLHYTPLQKREFETIRVDIKDWSGQFMPFLHGVLSAKLHFIKQNE